jgi:hypothetical protein
MGLKMNTHIPAKKPLAIPADVRVSIPVSIHATEEC